LKKTNLRTKMQKMVQTLLFCKLLTKALILSTFLKLMHFSLPVYIYIAWIKGNSTVKEVEEKTQFLFDICFRTFNLTEYIIC